MFKKKKLTPEIPYNPETQIPVLKCSICTGEQVAGFKDNVSGKFTEVMLIKDERDLNSFMKMYKISAVSKEY